MRECSLRKVQGLSVFSISAYPEISVVVRKAPSASYTDAENIRTDTQSLLLTKLLTKL